MKSDDQHRKTSHEDAHASSLSLPQAPWTVPGETIGEQLHVDPEKGLPSSEIKKRQHQWGLNRLKRTKKESILVIFLRQLESILVLLLVAAAIISFLVGKFIEGIAISAVIGVNTCIGFYTEWRAVRSMEALYQLTRVTAKVRRNNHLKKIAAEQLVPGDIVIVEAGDMVTADLRLVNASRLQVNESSLTGESVPVAKSVACVKDVVLAERTNMLYKGTAITRGSGEGIVVATGEDTELGRISMLIRERTKEETPLEKRLEILGRKLVWVTLGIAGVVAVSGILTGRDFLLMIETAIALAVATVPEGLPMVATMTLARGMWQMAKRNALLRRLSAVETLGSTTIICTDKTGTLTENQMTVTHIVVKDEQVEVTGTGLKDKGSFLIGEKERKEEVEPEGVLKKLLEIAVLCNNASLHDSQPVGDPTEVALLVGGEKAGLHRDELVKKYPEVREVSFDPEVNMMATFHRVQDTFMVAVKGAPEAVLQVSDKVMDENKNNIKKLTDDCRKKWLQTNEEMGTDGLRVLAVAFKPVDSVEADPYEELIFLGLIGLLDPPREEVLSSLKACQNAGIRVIMVTGDQPSTAKYIGVALQLIKEEDPVLLGTMLTPPLSEEEKEDAVACSVFARVSPEQKLTLVDIHQARGDIVAMTGDGVNDAPALRKADIGVAMGERGTQVAREAAEMILQDDDFSTIVNAVGQGRVIFDNIRRFVFYLLSCNISEILVIFSASLMSVPLPVLPLQILFLNVVTDIFPAFALAGSKGSPDIMEKPPRNPEEPVLTTAHWVSITSYSVAITLSVLAAFFAALFYFRMEPERAVTISFLTLAFAQLWHVFNMREKGSSFLKNEVTTNIYVWAALGLCSVLLGMATYVPGLSTVLKTVHPGITGWLLIMGASLFPWAAGQVSISVLSRKNSHCKKDEIRF